jgi:hypothetical protein
MKKMKERGAEVKRFMEVTEKFVRNQLGNYSADGKNGRQ